MRGKRRLVLAAAVVALTLGAAAGGVAAAGGKNGDNNGGGNGPYTIGLFGDMPYNTLGRQQYPNLLADINASRVAFSIFDGDLKAGADGP